MQSQSPSPASSCPLADATSNKCHASSNKCLTSSNKKLLGTSALLLVTMFASRNNILSFPSPRHLRSENSNCGLRLGTGPIITGWFICIGLVAPKGAESTFMDDMFRYNLRARHFNLPLITMEQVETMGQVIPTIPSAQRFFLWLCQCGAPFLAPNTCHVGKSGTLQICACTLLRLSTS